MNKQKRHNASKETSTEILKAYMNASKGEIGRKKKLKDLLCVDEDKSTKHAHSETSKVAFKLFAYAHIILFYYFYCNTHFFPLYYSIAIK